MDSMTIIAVASIVTAGMGPSWQASLAHSPNPAAAALRSRVRKSPESAVAMAIPASTNPRLTLRSPAHTTARVRPY